jgi:hypothetical protein
VTVGIGALCETESDPRAIVAADRLVTTGLGTRIEYEHTNSKMERITQSDGVLAVAVGAGAVSLTDELLYKTRGKLDQTQDMTVRSVVEKAVNASTDLIRESIERQVLAPYGFDSHNEFNKNQKALGKGMVNSIQRDILDKRDKIFSQMNVLIAGVDSEGAHLYGIRQNDMARHDSIGYHTVGSGSDPAESSFIRNQYDDTCDKKDAVMSVVEAKIRAEEAQGVGRQMDIAIISQDGIQAVDNDKIAHLREIHEEITEEERTARKSVLREKDYNLED